jgi:rRNA maturation endonuclease Nob1
MRIIIQVKKVKYLVHKHRICRRCSKLFETPCRRAKVCPDCQNPRGRPAMISEI